MLLAITASHRFTLTLPRQGSDDISDINQPESLLLLLNSLVLFLVFSRWVHYQRIITPDTDRGES